MVTCVHINRRLGKKPKVPNRESKPSDHAPAPHARHDESMARDSRVASPILGFMSCPPGPAASRVQFTKGCCRAAFCRSYKLILTILRCHGNPMDPNRLRSRTHVTTFKFQDALSLKNRLRSRTCVTTFKFHTALDLKNRLRSHISVATLMMNYVLEVRLRTCIQRASSLAFVWKSILFHTYNEILRIPCLTLI